MTATNSPDREMGLVSGFWTVHQTILQQKQHIELYRTENDLDDKMSHSVVSFTLNLCDFVKGIKSNLITRVIAEDWLRSLNSNLTCPILKGTTITLTNTTFTDTFVPPMPATKFRYDDTIFVKLKGQKKFVKVYKCSYYVTVKK